MANASAADRVLITFNGSLNSQRVMSTFMYGIGVVTGTPDMNVLFVALHAKLQAAGNLVPKFLACCPSNYTLLSIWYQIVAPGRFAKKELTPVPAVGTHDNTAFTSNLAAVIVRRGDVGNRKNVSTLHVPAPISTDVFEDGTIQGSYRDTLIALATQMTLPVVTAGTVATFNPVINNGPGIDDFRPITDAFPKPEVRVMRRRTVGLGI